MATAKKGLTGNLVQGHLYSSDPLDQLIAIAAEIANRSGLFDEDVIDSPAQTDGETKSRSTDHSGQRRSA
jgi:hypothetical protein